MEGSYGCNVNNRFELFLDDENDPLEVLAKQEEEKRKATDQGGKKDSKKDSKGKKVLSKQLAESVKTIAAVTLDGQAQTKPLGRRNEGPGGPPTGPGAPRGPRNAPARGDMVQRNNERNFESGDRPPRDFGDRPPRGGRGGRGGGGGGGRGGSGGPRGPPREGHRDFDRRSGTDKSGVKSIEKRGGQGAFNWGSNLEDQTAEEQQPTDFQNDSAENVEENAEGESPAEPQVVEKTFAEFTKERAARMSKASYTTNLRKPNEGEKEDPKLRKAKVIKKKKEESSDEHLSEEEESDDEDNKIKKQLEDALAAQFHFADQRGLPGRGRGRGRGTSRPQPNNAPLEGAPNMNVNANMNRRRNDRQNNAPRVEDLNDFPSLAA